MQEYDGLQLAAMETLFRPFSFASLPFDRFAQYSIPIKNSRFPFSSCQKPVFPPMQEYDGLQLAAIENSL